jgi:hypothetical protein
LSRWVTVSSQEGLCTVEFVFELRWQYCEDDVIKSSLLKSHTQYSSYHISLFWRIRALIMQTAVQIWVNFILKEDYTLKSDATSCQGREINV